MSLRVGPFLAAICYNVFIVTYFPLRWLFGKMGGVSLKFIFLTMTVLFVQ